MMVPDVNPAMTSDQKCLWSVMRVIPHQTAMSTRQACIVGLTSTDDLNKNRACK